MRKLKSAYSDTEYIIVPPVNQELGFLETFLLP